MTVRVVLSGLESTHADGLIDYLASGRRPETRVTTLVVGDTAPERVRALAERAGHPAIVSSAAEAAADADIAVICERDGRTHRVAAESYLRRGVAVLVDKPFACDPVDAHALVELAQAQSAVVCSFSPLRFHAEVPALAERLAERSEPFTLHVHGPADPDSPYAGIHYYGSHHADLVAALLDTPVAGVIVRAEGDGWLCSGASGPHRVQLHFEHPAPGSLFRVAVPERSEDIALSTDAHYLWPGLDAFFGAVSDGVAPIPETRLCEPVELMSTVADELAALR